MAEHRERAEWDRAAAVIAWTLTAQTGEGFAPAEFNPYRRDDLPGVAATDPERLTR